MAIDLVLTKWEFDDLLYGGARHPRKIRIVVDDGFGLHVNDFHRNVTIHALEVGASSVITKTEKLEITGRYMGKLILYFEDNDRLNFIQKSVNDIREAGRIHIRT